ncbi:MAG: TonB-dependent receptor [Agarilytica sp.]
MLPNIDFHCSVSRSGLKSLVLCIALGWTHASFAEETSFSALTEMSLEDLLNIEVTVSNRASESLRESASAVTVITSQQIKNSGLRTIPELLRLVPGMHVKRIDGNKWAINSRRAGVRFATSMLVLKDGRTLYNPLFAGTFWDAQDEILEDIERIEVIRGPGSAAWGANAISGVINIVTKSAKDTQGGQVFVGLGQGEMAYETGARYGVAVGNGFLRTYTKVRRTDEGRYLIDENSSNALFLDEPLANDGIQSSALGFRYDVQQGDASHQLQAALYDGRARDIRLPSGAKNVVHTDNYHVMYHYGRPLDSQSRFQFSTFYDHTEQTSDSFGDTRDIVDIEGIYHRQIDQHMLSLGVSYRYINDDTEQMVFGSGGFALDPASRDDEVVGAFIQNNWQIIPDRLSMVAGVRFEHNDYSGSEYNPSLRSTYTFDEEHSLWAAVTRSVRTPSRTESDAYLDFNASPQVCAFPGFTDDPNLGCVLIIAAALNEAEVTYSQELGYRQLLGQHMRVDATAFIDREIDPLADSSGVQVHHSKYQGVELEFTQQYERWRYLVNLSYFDIEPDQNSNIDSDDVEHWMASAQWHFKLSNELSWNAFISYNEGQNSFPNITRVDSNVILQVMDNLALQLTLNNILDEYHYESGDPTRMNSAIRRGGEILATYRF